MPGFAGHLNDQPVGKHGRAASDRTAVAAALADHRCRLACDSRFINRRRALDDLTIRGNLLAGLDQHIIPLLQIDRRDHRDPVRLIRCRDAACLYLFLGRAQCLGLSLAPTLGNRFREIGKQHGEPQQHRDTQRKPAGSIGCAQQLLQKKTGRQHSRHINQKHDRILQLLTRRELPACIDNRLPDDCPAERLILLHD